MEIRSRIYGSGEVTHWIKHFPLKRRDQGSDLHLLWKAGWTQQLWRQSQGIPVASRPASLAVSELQIQQYTLPP